MKKIILTLIVLLVPFFSWAENQEELLLINPGRETFINFPSVSTKKNYTVTFFFPEEYTPLKQRYPLVLFFGISPKQAEFVNAFVKKHRVLVVGIDVDSRDFENTEAMVCFVKKELLPYVDTNYNVYSDATKRVIATNISDGIETINTLLNSPDLFDGLALVLGGNLMPVLNNVAINKKVFVVGNQPQLANLQKKLTEQGLSYATNFVLKKVEQQDTNPFQYLDVNYFFEPIENLRVNKILPMLSVNKLKLDGSEISHLGILVQLNTGDFYNYFPADLKIGPHFLEWDNTTGILKVLPGAEKGTVRICNVNDDIPNFMLKVRLHK